MRGYVEAEHEGSSRSSRNFVVEDHNSSISRLLNGDGAGVTAAAIKR